MWALSAASERLSKVLTHTMMRTSFREKFQESLYTGLVENEKGPRHYPGPLVRSFLLQPNYYAEAFCYLTTCFLTIS